MVPLWIIFAFINPAMNAFGNFTDKFVLEDRIEDYRGYFLYGSILAFFVGVALLIYAHFPILTIRTTFLMILTGAVNIWGSFLYFRVLQKENTSKILFLFQMVSVITLILSYIFLHEVLSVKQLLGFALILIPGLIISNDGKFRLKLNEAAILIFIADFFWAAGGVIFKFASSDYSYINLIGWESLGWTVGGLIIFLLSWQVRASFNSTNKTLSRSTTAIIIFNEIIYFAAKMAGFFAISLGPVALVSVIGSTQLLFGILFGWILTMLAPAIFKEDITRKGLFQKLVWGLVIIFGIVLIT